MSSVKTLVVSCINCSSEQREREKYKIYKVLNVVYQELEGMCRETGWVSRELVESTYMYVCIYIYIQTQQETEHCVEYHQETETTTVNNEQY